MYMGKIIYGVLLLLAVGAGRLCAGQNEWENPEKYEWNKESPHTVFMWYEDESGALAGDFSKSPWYESLNGRWKFSYAPDIKDAEEGFYKKDFDDSSWADLDVPSNWELKGFGEPIIRNIQYVFPANPPYVDVDNPVGAYRKVFTVPEGWDGREVLLHFGSISGYAQVFLNGKRIGMTKAAKTPAEFNVTPYLCKGENLLAVRVYRWHDGSYMEDQDFWRLTGIERDVYLQAYPKSTVWDFFLHAGLDSRYRDGIFNATVDLRAFADSEPGKGQVEMKLVDKAGKTVWAQKRKFEMKGEAETLSFSGRIKNVAKWTAETPELYDCILTLRDGEGNTSVTACKTGFRKIEIKNAKLMVNGMPVYIKGVNRHEHSDTLGHVQTRDLILDDLKQMKRLNINAIRTCHYPNHPDFYDLCDRYGFYVVDEANIENHGMGSVPYFKDTVNHPAYREDWYAAHVDRIDRMVKRDKNHPCVIGWSLGNECGNGKVFHDEYKRLKAYDPSRFVQFEQAWEDWNTDVVCLMYPNMGRIKDYRESGKQRPFIMCEYAHAQGNSNGNFKDIWDVIYDSPNLQGGFIWDFKDQGFRMETESRDGRIYWMYNGKMGSYKWLEDKPSEWNTGTDGILSADGTPKPQAWEVKKVYQYIQFEGKDTAHGWITVRNRHDFTNLKDYAFAWEICRNGEKTASGTFSVDLLPHGQKDIRLDLPEIPDDGNEYFLNLYAYTKTASGLLPAGYEVAKEQLKLGEGDFFARMPEASGNLEYRVDDGVLVFASGDVSGKIDLKKGVLADYAIRGVRPFKKYPEPAFWRAPVDNDFGNKMPWTCGVWRTAHVNRYVKNATVGERTPEGLPVKVEWILTDIQVPYTMEFLVRNDGSLQVSGTMDMTGKKLPELPRFGMRMELAGRYENLCYYGRGPQENYIDRWSSAFVGRYEDKVENQYYPYARPQETGNKTDVRWLSLSDGEGTEVEITGVSQPIAFSALHYAPEDLDPGLTRKMQHSIDVVPQKDVFLHVDLKQRGLGGDNSWGMFPYNPYRLWDKKYSYSYLIRLK